MEQELTFTQEMAQLFANNPYAVYIVIAFIAFLCFILIKKKGKSFKHVYSLALSDVLQEAKEKGMTVDGAADLVIQKCIYLLKPNPTRANRLIILFLKTYLAKLAVTEFIKSQIEEINKHKADGSCCK